MRPNNFEADLGSSLPVGIGGSFIYRCKTRQGTINSVHISTITVIISRHRKKNRKPSHMVKLPLIASQVSRDREFKELPTDAPIVTLMAG